MPVLGWVVGGWAEHLPKGGEQGKAVEEFEQIGSHVYACVCVCVCLCTSS